jgi:hypothetical protein
MLVPKENRLNNILLLIVNKNNNDNENKENVPLGGAKNYRPHRASY